MTYPTTADVLSMKLRDAGLDVRRSDDGRYNVLVDKLTGREWGEWFFDDIKRVSAALCANDFTPSTHFTDPEKRNEIIERVAAKREIPRQSRA